MKSTIIFPVFFLFFVTDIHSQRWSVALNLSPDLCHRYIHANEPGFEFNIDHQRDWDHPKLGYTAGLTGIVSFDNGFEIEAGALYSNKGYQSRVLIEQPVNMPGSLPKEVDYRFDDHCLDIPVKVNYLAGSGRLQFIGSLAVTSNFFIIEKYYSTYFYSNGTTKEHNDEDKNRYNAYMLTPEIGAGVKWSVGERFGIRGLPTFRYTVLNVQENKPIKTNLYSLGLAFALVYRIGS